MARAFEGYAAGGDRPPLGSYAVMSAAFAAGTGAYLVAARRGRAPMPELSNRDIVLVGAATHKLSRLIAKDRVTSFLRAPFRRYQDAAGPGELSEEARGSGLRAAVGELIGCPYCLGLWIASGMAVGLGVAPRETRLAASTLSALTIADFLQIAYGYGQQQL
jgi:uncharacterized protein DUF1360